MQPGEQEGPGPEGVGQSGRLAERIRIARQRRAEKIQKQKERDEKKANRIARADGDKADRATPYRRCKKCGCQFTEHFKETPIWRCHDYPSLFCPFCSFLAGAVAESEMPLQEKFKMVEDTPDEVANQINDWVSGEWKDPRFNTHIRKAITLLEKKPKKIKQPEMVWRLSDKDVDEQELAANRFPEPVDCSPTRCEFQMPSCFTGSIEGRCALAMKLCGITPTYPKKEIDSIGRIAGKRMTRKVMARMRLKMRMGQPDGGIGNGEEEDRQYSREVKAESIIEKREGAEKDTRTGTGTGGPGGFRGGPGSIKGMVSISAGGHGRADMEGRSGGEQEDEPEPESDFNTDPDDI